MNAPEFTPEELKRLRESIDEEEVERHFLPKEDEEKEDRE